jgi:hypothetical protein
MKNQQDTTQEDAVNAVVKTSGTTSQPTGVIVAEQCTSQGDKDVDFMYRSQLKDEVRRLRNGIRQHRDEKGHDRCWLDDQRLYALLNDGVEADMKLPCKPEFLENCDKYWETRQPSTKRSFVKWFF